MKSLKKLLLLVVASSFLLIGCGNTTTTGWIATPVDANHPRKCFIIERKWSSGFLGGTTNTDTIGTFCKIEVNK